MNAVDERNRVARITTWIAGLVAVAVTVLPPIGYYSVSFQYLSGSLEAEAEVNGGIISGLINSRPETWQYEQVRLEELLARRLGNVPQETRRILDMENRLVAESVSPLRPPLVKRTSLLLDSGIPVGRLEISRSMFPILLYCFLVSLLGFASGLLVFITLRVLPLRAVARAERALREANGTLQTEIAERRNAEEKVLRLNAELELKVAERTRELLDTQEELVRKEKLATLGQLAGSVGHELRNPLGVMSNAVYFLKSIMPDADETVREYLGIIKDEIGNSQRIITDLLDFARTKTPQARPVSPAQLVQESLARCAIPENVTCQAEIPASLPPLLVDPLQMGQVLQNIITNGVQAMPDGGSLRISTRKLEGATSEARGAAEETLEPSGDFVEIRVADTGEGIAPEQMKKLFQPLFTTKAKGIGLGLTVCRNLTEANGGRIEVESLVGEGTTFTLLLPVEREGE